MRSQGSTMIVVSGDPIWLQEINNTNIIHIMMMLQPFIVLLM